MKQKLFENVGGNQFKLISEGVIADENPKGKLVREGLRKVFSAGNKELSYKRLQGVGMGYIKSVEEAKKCAIQEARELASEYGYVEDENSQKFVKEDGDIGATNQEESWETKQLQEIIKLVVTGRRTPSQSGWALDQIEKIARRLISTHRKQ